jgi:hypothetical protein
MKLKDLLESKVISQKLFRKIYGPRFVPDVIDDLYDTYIKNPDDFLDSDDGETLADYIDDNLSESSFQEALGNDEPKEIYNGIIPDIRKKYEKVHGKLTFKNSMGSLSVKKGKTIIGHINRKNIDRWEEIIDKKLELIKNKPADGKVADETNVVY